MPPVLDARDVLENPQLLLGLLCDAIGVEFTSDMLSWPQGRRDTDGIWAKHWYNAVEASTGFNPYRPKPDPVPPQLADLHEQCVGYYETLHEHRLGQ